MMAGMHRVVVDTKTARETARCVINVFFLSLLRYLQFVDKLIMTYSKWYSIPGAVDKHKPP